jgi:predicted secreted protein
MASSGMPYTTCIHSSLAPFVAGLPSVAEYLVLVTVDFIPRQHAIDTRLVQIVDTMGAVELPRYLCAETGEGGGEKVARETSTF